MSDTIVAELREALKLAQAKLQMYHEAGKSQRVGGMEYTALMLRINKAIEASNTAIARGAVPKEPEHE